MDERAWLAERFEENRGHLRAVAYRMLGSLSEADDAVQESWLRLNRTGADGVENLGGWLTTVVARVSLDMLRSRASRREEPLDSPVPGALTNSLGGADPESEALLADSVGLALLVVLETLAPAERLAFVLHDLFGVPFDEIAPLVERSPAAARQLASRARRRVRGADPASDSDLSRQKEVVDAFFAATRGGDLGALLAVLDPEIVVRSDPAAMRFGAPAEERGAVAVAARVVKGGARAARLALINGAVGAIVAPRGRLLLVLDFTVEGGKIVAIDAIADPARLGQLDVRVLGV